MMNQLVTILQQALRTEHQAYLQYLTHREQIRGACAPSIMALLDDSAQDEARHAAKLCTLLADYLGIIPTAEVAFFQPTDGAIPNVVAGNLPEEQDAITLYKQIYALIRTMRGSELDLAFRWFNLEKAIREIIVEEEEHIVELERLL